ncbi:MULTISPECIES: hypothetical protein [Streptomyces]|nr:MULTISPECIES: hypothetical protein [Streptomyces]MDI5904913.1 hypothetical protein [Streptomyces sp. 12257]
MPRLLAVADAAALAGVARQDHRRGLRLDAPETDDGDFPYA